MMIKNPDLHGNAPDKCSTALLLVDLINDFEFPEAEELLRFTLPMAERVVALKRRAKSLGIPAIYVNDNFGRWQSNFHALIEHCLHDDVPGKAIVKLLQPEDDDYFVLKPKHSGFYSTTLELLLKHLGTKTVVIVGIAGNICVLFTASDAYLRDFHIVVPADCVASNTAEENSVALQLMRKILKAETTDSTQLNLQSKSED